MSPSIVSLASLLAVPLLIAIWPKPLQAEDTAHDLIVTSPSSPSTVYAGPCKNGGFLESERCDCRETAFQGEFCEDVIGIRVQTNTTLRVNLPEPIEIGNFHFSVNILAKGPDAKMLSFEEKSKGVVLFELIMNEGQMFLLWFPDKTGSRNPRVKIGEPVPHIMEDSIKKYYFEIKISILRNENEENVYIKYILNDFEMVTPQLQIPKKVVMVAISHVTIGKFTGCITQLIIQKDYFPFRALRFPQTKDTLTFDTSSKDNWTSDTSLYCDQGNPFTLQRQLLIRRILWTSIVIGILIGLFLIFLLLRRTGRKTKSATSPTFKAKMSKEAMRLVPKMKSATAFHPRFKSAAAQNQDVSQSEIVMTTGPIYSKTAGPINELTESSRSKALPIDKRFQKGNRTHRTEHVRE
jgi:hypothetical protein